MHVVHPEVESSGRPVVCCKRGVLEPLDHSCLQFVVPLDASARLASSCSPGGFPCGRRAGPARSNADMHFNTVPSNAYTALEAGLWNSN